MAEVRQRLAGVVYPSADDLATYAAAGLFRDLTLGQAFREIARRFADRIAVADERSGMTYRELDRQTDDIAAGLLAAGLAPHDRATFQVGNGIQLVQALLACLKAGIIPICTLTAHRRAEIGYLSRHAGARAHFICTDDPKFDFAAFSREMRGEAPSLALTVVVRGECPAGDPSFVGLDALARSGRTAAATARLGEVEDDPCQVALFQLSGGTSGVPKIIPRFHNEYLYQIESVARWHRLDETTIAFTPAPMMHNAPLICYWGPALWGGGEVACATAIDPDSIARVIAARRPNWMSIPLPLLIRLQEATLLDREIFAGARLSTPSHAARLDALTGAKAVPLYGMTEGIISYGRVTDPPAVVRDTVGRPISDFDRYRIVDPQTRRELPRGELGEFCFTGPSSVRGYYDAADRNAEAFTPDGFCLSGDLMREREIDGEVYLSFEGRVKDVVSRGGEKINCQEVERALIDHPAIGAIAVVPMPDPVYGERTCAFVIPKRGAGAPTVAEAGRFLERAGLAKFKWPERIESVAEFPLTSSGKLSKPKLRETIADILRREAPEPLAQAG